MKKDSKRYTAKDLKHAKRVGIEEGIEQARSVVLEMDKTLLSNMSLCIANGKPESAERYRSMHEVVLMIWQDLNLLGKKVK